MWKAGQLVTLNGSVYRVTKCKYPTGYKACMFCQQRNMKPPCIEAFDYAQDKLHFNGFDLHNCRKNIPNLCIPVKLLIPSYERSRKSR